MIDPTGWVLASVGSFRLVGRLKGNMETGIVLSPVYELTVSYVIVQLEPNKPPEVRFGTHHVAPVFGYLSIEQLELPTGTLLIPVQKLSLADQNGLAKGIEGFEVLRAKQRSGIIADSATLNAEAARLKGLNS